MKRLRTIAVSLLMTMAGLGTASSPDGVIGDNYGTVFGRSVVSEFPNLTGPSPYMGAMAMSTFGQTWLFGEFDSLDATNKLPIARLLSTSGALDPAFGAGSGVVTSTFPAAGTWYTGLTAQIQTDGKPLIAGTMTIAGFRRGFVCRLNAAGNFDGTFANAGCREIRAFNYTNEDCSLEDLALGSPNGGITVVGQCRDRDNVGPQRPFTARLTATGAFDTEFAGGAGLSSPTIANARLDYLKALTMQADGRFIAVGSAMRVTNEYDIAVLQFSNDGTLDPAFGAGGRVMITVDFAGQFNDFGTDIAVRPDGRVLVAGLAEGFTNDGEIVLQQLHADGSNDASYGSNGVVLGSESLVDITNGVPQNGPFFARMRLAVDDLGRAVVIGRSGSPVAGSDADVRVFRFTANGAKDSAFSYDQRGVVDIDNDVAVPGPGSSHDIPTYVGIDRERIVLGTISIRDSKAYMATLTLQSVALFSDGFETD